MSGSWPECGDVESLKVSLDRARAREQRREEQCRHSITALHLLTSHIEWDLDGKATLDTNELAVTWRLVEEALEKGEEVLEVGNRITPRNQGQAPTERMDSLERVWGRVQNTLREARGLDLSRPITELERDAWRREFSLQLLTLVGQLFDPASGLCLGSVDLARWRRRRALEIVIHAIELSALHGVSAEALLREVEP